MKINDRMKMYESQETSRKFVFSGVPVIARLDGRGFSKFTKSMNRPFDLDFTKLMQNTAAYLLKECSAEIAYTQSDEITLVFYKNYVESDIFFAGKIQKMVSVLSSLATAYFVSQAISKFPQECAKKLPVFDCRLFQVPSKDEAVNCVLWRMQDAERNSVSMLGRAYFSHSEMTGVCRDDVIYKLRTEKNVFWDELNPELKYGSFAKKVQYTIPGTETIRNKIEIVTDSGFNEMNHDDRVYFIFGDDND